MKPKDCLVCGAKDSWRVTDYKNGHYKCESCGEEVHYLTYAMTGIHTWEIKKELK